MRAVIAGLLAACLALPVLADEAVESVTVSASALAGIWKITWPQGFAITFAHGTTFGPMQVHYCRMEQVRRDLLVHCFAGDLGRDGTINLDGDKIHLAWGTMMMRTVMDGVLQSDSGFAARFGFKLSGLSHDDPEPAGGEKLHIAAGSSDPPGKATLVGTILSGGKPSAIPDDALAKLGSIEAIAYLGQGPKFGSATELDYFTIYAVEFTNGERICGLHQRNDGVLDAFLCL